MSIPTSRETMFRNLAEVMTQIGKQQQPLSTEEKTADEQKIYIKVGDNNKFITVIGKEGKKSKGIEAEKLAKTIESIILAVDKSNVFEKVEEVQLEGMIKGLETLRNRIQAHQDKISSMTSLKRFFLKLFGYTDQYDSVIERINASIDKIKLNILPLQIKKLEEQAEGLAVDIEKDNHELKKLTKISEKYHYTIEGARQANENVTGLKRNLMIVRAQRDKLIEARNQLASSIGVVHAEQKVAQARKDKEEKENVQGANYRILATTKAEKDLKQAKENLEKAEKELKKLIKKINKDPTLKGSVRQFKELSKQIDKKLEEEREFEEKLQKANSSFEIMSKNILDRDRLTKTRNKKLEEVKKLEDEIKNKQRELDRLQPPQESPLETSLFDLPKDASLLEKRVMGNIKLRLGLGELKARDYVDYQRRIIFGFSIGQKVAIEHLSEKIDLNLEDLKKMLESGDDITNLYYVAYLIERLLKTKEGKDSAYIKALEQLQSDVKRSLPIAFKLAVIRTSTASHKEKEIKLKTLAKEVSRTLSHMKVGDILFLPSGTTKHATLLSFKKMNDGKILPTLYNTGEGVDQHLVKDANIKAFFSAAISDKYPTTLRYPPIMNLNSNRFFFEEMITEILSISLTEDRTIEEMNRVLTERLGNPKPGQSRRIQINGICSFQVLTEGIRDHMITGKTREDKKTYRTFKLDILKHIQTDFQAFTQTITPTTTRKRQELELHQALLDDNARLIRKTAKAIGIEAD